MPCRPVASTFPAFPAVQAAHSFFFAFFGSLSPFKKHPEIIDRVPYFVYFIPWLKSRHYQKKFQMLQFALSLVSVSVNEKSRHFAGAHLYTFPNS